MSVKTAKVRGRRALRFESWDELLAEAERLAAEPNLELLGNWSLGQILQHLASALHLALDGNDYRSPFFMRLAGPLLKSRVLNRGLTPGFRLPQGMRQLVPDETTTDQGLASLREAVSRFRNGQPQPRHFVFGKMSPQEWVELHLRHAELHLSFAAPAGTTASGDG